MKRFTAVHGNYTFSLTVNEKPDKVEMTPHCTPSLDRLDLEARKALAEFLMPILEKYDSDPRPTVMFNPLYGQTMTIWGDADNSIGIVTQDNKGN